MTPNMVYRENGDGDFETWTSKAATLVEGGQLTAVLKEFAPRKRVLSVWGECPRCSHDPAFDLSLDGVVYRLDGQYSVECRCAGEHPGSDGRPGCGAMFGVWPREVEFEEQS
jgi:hypothetical protein